MKNNNFKGTINYFISYTSIFSSTPLRNSIRCFFEEDYKIRVFQFADERIKALPTDLDEKYELIEIHYPKIAKYLLFVVKTFFRSLKHIGIGKLSTVGDGIDALFKNLIFITGCVFKNKCANNEVYIGGDPGALIAANTISKKKKGRLIHWSLELCIEKEMPNFGMKILKREERKINQYALYTIEFGEQRSRILQKENKLNPISMISIPNSQIGKGKIVRNHFFNDKFNIPRNKVIILHAGGLYTPSVRVKDIFESVYEWPIEYVLVLHTHQRNYPLSGFKLPDEYLNKRIYVNNDPLPFDQLDMVYSSCDIGIMVHGGLDIDNNLNHHYSDLSVGKIFHHLKVGVPVIVRNLPGYKELFEKNMAGACIEEPSDILPAIKIIMKNHEQYKKGALNLHEKYRFELHHSKLIEKIGLIYGN